MKDKYTELLEYFRHENMTTEERDIIITFLYNTKLLEDTEGTIVSCNFKKIDDSMYKANGMIYSKITENCCFNAWIVVNKNKVSIESDIVRLCSDHVDKKFYEYTNFTKIKDNIYNRQTKYSHIDATIESKIVIDNFGKIYQDSNAMIKNNNL